MKCYICENEMDYIETIYTKLLQETNIYKCPKCGEIIYERAERK